MKKVDPLISEHMAWVAKQRKKPYLNFKDSEAAKAAGERGRETQRRQREAKKATESQNTTKVQSQASTAKEASTQPSA